jgi:glyoxalase family protein
VAEKGDRFRFGTTNKNGGFVDLVCRPDSLKGLGGSGTVHHLAFSTPTDNTQAEVRERIVERMFDVTPPLNRQYFNSIYFREPGGVLFEVATATPGFLIDEQKEHLGEELKLPSWLEKSRKEISQSLDSIQFYPAKFK